MNTESSLPTDSVDAHRADFTRQPAIPSQAPQSSPSGRKRRLVKTLPTDRIPFPRQLEIISAIPVAYEKANTPITFKEVGSILGMSEATLLQMSAFLSDVGLTQRTESGKFTPAPELLDYLRVHQYSPEKAWPKLGPLLEKSWFGQELLTRLKFRPIEEHEALVALVEVSGAEKLHEAQLKIAIEYLSRMGLVVREGSLLRLSAHKPEPVHADPVPAKGAPKADQDGQIAGLKRYAIPLKADKQLVIFAPESLTKKELRRVQMWLRFQLIIDDLDDDDDFGFVHGTKGGAM